ncbi:MAG: alanine--glyoxylate aminotransferase family protein [Planctomycetota bacterium]
MKVPGELNPGSRILLGPGPSDCHPRVLRAMSTPLLGHLDPEFLSLMEDVQAMLRAVFQTDSKMTLPISGTGSAAMEAAVANLIEPGEVAVVGVHGVFGGRIAAMVERAGGRAVKVEAPWGSPLDPEDIERALKGDGAGAKLVAAVHAETSTGVLQPLAPLARLAQQHGALFLADTVTSLGGHPVDLKGWHVDVAFSGSQKCLGVPPGIAPLTFNERAMEVVSKRKEPCRSWYLDLGMIGSYWGTERVYHHTAPITMIYALYEGLRVVLEEGLESRWERHRENHVALVAGLEAMGFQMNVEREGERLWTLNAVTVPNGIDEAKVRKHLLEQHGIEIGGGLGPLKGKIWRIGLMGYSSQRHNVFAVLAALEEALHEQGRKQSPGAGVAAALESYRG